jgi:aromatic ring-cleaving dioxygenase
MQFTSLVAILAVMVVSGNGATPNPCRDKTLPRPPILSWHVHVVFDDKNPNAANGSAAALKLRSDAMKQFNISADCDVLNYSAYQPREPTACVIQVQPTAVYPFEHVGGRWRFSLPTDEMMGEVVAWMTTRRGALSLFIHPLTGCQFDDHVGWAW